VHLVGFIIRIYHDTWSPERQEHQTVFGLYHVYWHDPITVSFLVCHSTCIFLFIHLKIKCIYIYIYTLVVYNSIIISDMETHIISSPERFVQFYHSTLQYPESWNDHIVNNTQADIAKNNNKYKYIIPYSAIRKCWKIWCTAKIGVHMSNANRVHEKDFTADFETSFAITFCPQIQIQESFLI